MKFWGTASPPIKHFSGIGLSFEGSVPEIFSFWGELQKSGYKKP
jgi:hypothetical protein